MKRGRFDAVEVAYGRFKNAAMQDTESVPFLPVPKLEVEEEETNTKQIRADYIFEPSKEELLNHLVPSILQNYFS